MSGELDGSIQTQHNHEYWEIVAFRALKLCMQHVWTSSHNVQPHRNSCWTGAIWAIRSRFATYQMIQGQRQRQRQWDTERGQLHYYMQQHITTCKDMQGHLPRSAKICRKELWKYIHGMLQPLVIHPLQKLTVHGWILFINMNLGPQDLDKLEAK